MRVSASQTGTGRDEHGRDGGREAAQLADRELSGLRAVGRQWQGSVQDRASWERALPVDPQLSYEAEPGARRGRFVQIRSGRAEHPLPAGAALDGTDLPEHDDELRGALMRASAVGRISPEGKERVLSS